jgi:hypothetical protein
MTYYMSRLPLPEQAEAYAALREAEPCCEVNRKRRTTMSVVAPTWLRTHRNPAFAAWAVACTTRAPECTK